MWVHLVVWLDRRAVGVGWGGENQLRVTLVRRTYQGSRGWKDC